MIFCGIDMFNSFEEVEKEFEKTLWNLAVPTDEVKDFLRQVWDSGHLKGAKENYKGIGIEGIQKLRSQTIDECIAALPSAIDAEDMKDLAMPNFVLGGWNGYREETIKSLEVLRDDGADVKKKA